MLDNGFVYFVHARRAKKLEKERERCWEHQSVMAEFSDVFWLQLDIFSIVRS